MVGSLDKEHTVFWTFAKNAEKFHGGVENYLVIMDESHVTLPQVGGMFGGDFSRKKILSITVLDYHQHSIIGHLKLKNSKS